MAPSSRRGRSVGSALDRVGVLWDNPTMIVIADKKRRVVLPKPAQPGDVFECQERGDRFLLVRLKPAARSKPPVSKKPLKPAALKGVNLDEPAFAPLRDESLD